MTKATYVFRSDDAVRAAMVGAGEADIVPLINQNDATNPATDFTYPNSETTYLRVDNTVAPMNDIRVRKAMNLAIDRDAFLGTLIPADAIKAVAMVAAVDARLEPGPEAVGLRSGAGEGAGRRSQGRRRAGGDGNRDGLPHRTTSRTWSRSAKRCSRCSPTSGST